MTEGTRPDGGRRRAIPVAEERAAAQEPVELFLKAPELAVQVAVQGRVPDSRRRSRLHHAFPASGFATQPRGPASQLPSVPPPSCSHVGPGSGSARPLMRAAGTCLLPPPPPSLPHPGCRPLTLLPRPGDRDELSRKSGLLQ